MNQLQLALARQNSGRPPVWMMRQAGRYHSHYQKLKEKHTFMELCKIPKLACETTLGPIDDFDFDAAILFSDLLFPLEAMGMGLSYTPGPTLEWHLKSTEDLSRLKFGSETVRHFQFQADALRLIRRALPQEKGLIGFVGGPLTLFMYAVEGSHQGELNDSKKGLIDGRYERFLEKLIPILVENMAFQAAAGAETIALFDTCAGELDAISYKEHVVPALKEVLTQFKSRFPEIPLIYYSKGTGPKHWEPLQDLPISCLGIDWNHSLPEILEKWSDRWAIQGNINPHWLHLDAIELEKNLRFVFDQVKSLPEEKRRGWVCGLGHGVLQKTPEDNVRLFIRLQREIFKERGQE